MKTYLLQIFGKKVCAWFKTFCIAEAPSTIKSHSFYVLYFIWVILKVIRLVKYVLLFTIMQPMQAKQEKIFGSSPPCLYVGDHSILADQLGLLDHMLRTSPYYRLAGCKCLVMQHEVLCPPWCWGSIWQFFHSIQFHSILPHLPPPLWSCSFPRSHEVTCSELNHETWVSILAHRIFVSRGSTSSLISVKN